MKPNFLGFSSSPPLWSWDINLRWSWDINLPSFGIVIEVKRKSSTYKSRLLVAISVVNLYYCLFAFAFFFFKVSRWGHQPAQPTAHLWKRSKAPFLQFLVLVSLSSYGTVERSFSCQQKPCPCTGTNKDHFCLFMIIFFWLWLFALVIWKRLRRENLEDCKSGRRELIHTVQMRSKRMVNPA